MFQIPWIPYANQPYSMRDKKHVEVINIYTEGAACTLLSHIMGMSMFSRHYTSSGNIVNEINNGFKVVMEHIKDMHMHQLVF